MKNRKFGIGTLVLAVAAAMFGGIVMTAAFDFTQTSEAQNFWKESSEKDTAAFTPRSFVELAKRLAPSVVNISTTQVMKQRPFMPFPEFKTPFDEFFGDEFRKPFGDEHDFKRQSLGSGFIINKEGYILTNNHVIENAAEILVTLSGKDKLEYPAKVMGKDSQLDVALIKIEADGELPVAALGDSDKLDIGEWVVAIGNPFGLGGTVTAGIVSQKGRVIGAGPYDNFIQTDASINPGNSGGPLFNLKGEVVGINTAIIAGGQGIGFATPINMVKEVALQLKEKGAATRGWIGVTIQEVTPDMASSFGLKRPMGALVSSVVELDPAAEGGIKAGDVIIEFNGKPIEEMNDLPRTVAATPPGKKVLAKVVRDGREIELYLTLKKKSDGDEGEIAGKDSEKGKDNEVEAGLGIFAMDITPELAKKFDIKDASGVFIHNVKDDSPASDIGLRRWDIIKEVNRAPVKNVGEFKKQMETAMKKKVVLLFVKRGDGVFYAAIKVKEAKPEKAD
ncbi:MAG: DegQ family serine endoprotease [Thermodesulfobacteriota bacterium]